jgi:hypothetical protein
VAAGRGRSIHVPRHLPEEHLNARGAGLHLPAPFRFVNCITLFLLGFSTMQSRPTFSQITGVLRLRF